MVGLVPITFDEKGRPNDPKLCAALVGYYETETGVKDADFSKVGKVLACVETDGESMRVIGICAASTVVDIPLFHSSSPKAYAVMFRRLHDWAEDLGVSCVLVHVDPKNYRHIKSILERVEARPAHRWRAKVGFLKTKGEKA